MTENYFLSDQIQSYEGNLGLKGHNSISIKFLDATLFQLRLK